MAKAEESLPVAELKKLGEERVAAEVRRLYAEWDRLTGEFLPVHEKLSTVQGNDADLERLIAERSRILGELKSIGDRLTALGATRASGLGMAAAPGNPHP
jgi:hypothetical protein